MSTAEASWPSRYIVDIHCYDVTCPSNEGRHLMTDSDVERNVAQTNAILMRSNATFKIRIKKSTVRLPVCSTNGDIVSRSAFVDLVAGYVNLTDVAAHVFIVDINGGTIRGFGTPHIAVVNREDIKKPRKTLTHELGHAFNLSHTFAPGFHAPDIPPVCATEATRPNQLEWCPLHIRTCPGATQDEMTENTMDYLPEICGRKYRFVPSQVDTMLNYLELKYLGTI